MTRTYCAVFTRAGLLCAVLAVTLLLGGCGIGQRSPATRYYVLALPEGEGPAFGARAVTGPVVGIGPVTVPGYLDRRQMFIRHGDAFDVSLAEYDQWGENLAEGATRLLAASVSAGLADQRGIALPLRAGNPVDWRISITINRFDGAPDADVILDAGWTLSDKNGMAVREGHFIDKVGAGGGIDGLVGAHGELLARLGQTLAKAVRLASSPTPRS